MAWALRARRPGTHGSRVTVPRATRSAPKPATHRRRAVGEARVRVPHAFKRPVKPFGGGGRRHDIKAWRLCPCTTPLRLIA